MPQGKALDLSQVGPVVGSDATITGANDYGPTAGSDLFIVTAGIARKPGMSRDDLLKTNTGIVKAVAEQIKKTSPNAFVIVVSNPLDAMCYVMKQVTGFPRERVIGMAGVLDSARMATFIAQELKVSVKNVNAFVMGGHGDTMVPMPRYTTVAGVPLPELLSKDKIDAIVKRTANGGAEIVALLKTGSAFYAPSASAVQMAEAILYDRRQIFPCAVWLQGEYGLKDVYVGVPVKLGARGLEEVIQLKLIGGRTGGFEQIGGSGPRTAEDHRSLMLLAIDVGNTHITVGLFRDRTLQHTWRLNTHRHYTSDELGIHFLNLLATKNLDASMLDGVCIASVVPSLDEPLTAMSRTYLRQTPIVVGPETRLGIKNLYRKPEEVGADRLVNAVAVHALYRKPVIVVDFGTATTFDCVSARGDYLGGAICPGLELAGEWLATHTAKLPQSRISNPAGERDRKDHKRKLAKRPLIRLYSPG